MIMYNNNKFKTIIYMDYIQMVNLIKKCNNKKFLVIDQLKTEIIINQKIFTIYMKINKEK